MKLQRVLVVLAVVGGAVAWAFHGDDADEALYALKRKGLDDAQLVPRGSAVFDYTARRDGALCRGSVRVGFIRWVTIDCRAQALE